jgi:hypothetical protein
MIASFFRYQRPVFRTVGPSSEGLVSMLPVFGLVLERYGSAVGNDLLKPDEESWLGKLREAKSI